MKKTILMMMATMATTLATAQHLQYPKAVKDGTVDEYFGTKVSENPFDEKSGVVVNMDLSLLQ